MPHSAAGSTTKHVMHVVKLASFENYEKYNNQFVRKRDLSVTESSEYSQPVLWPMMKGAVPYPFCVRSLSARRWLVDLGWTRTSVLLFTLSDVPIDPFLLIWTRWERHGHFFESKILSYRDKQDASRRTHNSCHVQHIQYTHPFQKRHSDKEWDRQLSLSLPLGRFDAAWDGP